MEHYKMFINGTFTDGAGGNKYEVIDPGTGKPYATVAKGGAEDAEAAIMAARMSFEKGEWSGLKPGDRLDKVLDFADEIIKRGLRFAMNESINGGMVLGLAKFMPLMCLNHLKNMGLLAANEFPWEEEIPVSGNVFAPGRDYIRREPIGVCVGIIPWNFPLSMAIWKIAPAIVMGNSIVLKPATLTPLTALILAEAAQAAGIPEGVINVVPGDGSEIGKILCTHPEVNKIAFTGSTEVGRGIMKMASDTVKKVTLELGGKSANIILDDADMDLAVEGAMFGTFFHQGQVCESGTRVLVAAKIYDEFVEKFKKRSEALRIGYQLDSASHMGPLVSRNQLETVNGYVKLGKKEGAEIITGGEPAEVTNFPDGFYYKPTIFTNVKNSMRIAREEIFGPVVCVMKFHDDEEAISIANDSIYGLGGGVFSTNNTRAEHIARGVKTGTMWINNYHIFSDFCPFGGVKQSGVGRELGAEGLKEYVQVKRIHFPVFANHKSNMTFKIMSDKKRVDNFAYQSPTSIIAGHGSLSSIQKIITMAGCKRAIIITDKGVRDAGLAQRVKDALSEFCAGIYDKVPQDPDLEAVDSATEYAREIGADCIVSVGGGSVIDTAKALCVTLKNGGKVKNYLNLMGLKEPQTPHIAVPTTSGTGSEVTNASVLTSNSVGRKLYIIDRNIIPVAAILDPVFTIGLPMDLTVATAMDAMTHAIEAVSSIMSNPICDGQALHAIRLIHDNLPALVKVNGRDEKARLNMQVAATMAGWAFSTAQVGLAHAMAHTLGILHKIPHGTACGLMIPKVLRFNADHAPDGIVHIAQSLGVNAAGMSSRDAALASADALEELMKEVNHPLKISDINKKIKEEDLMSCAFHAIADTANLFNARPVKDPQEILDLYKQVL